MTHRLVVTTTRTVLESEQRHNCELNVSACPVLRSARAARRDLQKPKRSDGCSESESRLRAEAARHAVVVLAPACTSVGIRYLVSTMPHRLVPTMTRTVLENEQIPNSERTSAHVLCCGQHGRHEGIFRNRSVLTDVRNPSRASEQKRRVMQWWCWPRRAHLIWCQLCRIGSCRQ